MTLPLDNPAIVDMSAVSNADVSESCLFQDQNRVAVDLTGGSLSMDIKETLAGSALLSLSSAATTANGSGLVITDATGGAFNMIVKAADLAALPFGSKAAIAAVYDLKYTDSSARTIRVAKGRFIVEKGVTV